MIDCKLFIEKEVVLSIRKQFDLLDITRSNYSIISLKGTSYLESNKFKYSLQN